MCVQLILKQAFLLLRLVKSLIAPAAYALSEVIYHTFPVPPSLFLRVKGTKDITYG